MTVIFLLFLFPFAPFIISMVIPRGWLPPYAAAMSALWLSLWLDESRCVNCGLLSIAMTNFGSLIAGVVVRTAWAMYRPASDGSIFGSSVPSQVIAWTIAAFMSALLLAGMGVAATWSFESGWLTHGTVFLLGLGWFLAFRWFGRNETGSRILLWAPQYAGVAAIVGASAWSLQVAPSVLEAASLAAGGKPYCIQVSAVNGMRAARSKLDLSGFMMRAGLQSDRHGSLAIGDPLSPEWMYWSYRRNAFLPEFLGSKLNCQLRPNGHDLPYFAASP